MKVEKYAGAQLRRGGGGIVNKKFKRENAKKGHIVKTMLITFLKIILNSQILYSLMSPRPSPTKSPIFDFQNF